MTVMIYSLPADPYLLEIKSSFVGRFMCEHGFHDFSRWQRKPATIKEGRKIREITIQMRECVRPSCGFSQTKYL